MAPSMSKLSDKQYSEILRSVDFAPASYKELAAALMVNGVKQMFHVGKFFALLGLLMALTNTVRPAKNATHFL